MVQSCRHAEFGAIGVSKSALDGSGVLGSKASPQSDCPHHNFHKFYLMSALLPAAGWTELI